MIPLLFIAALLIAVICGLQVIYWAVRLAANFLLLLMSLATAAGEHAARRREP